MSIADRVTQRHAALATSFVHWEKTKDIVDQ